MQQFEERARAALSAHPGLAKWFRDAVPRQYQTDPAVIRQIMGAALAADPKLADAKLFADAYGAVMHWQQAADLHRRASELFWDPRIRSEFSEEQLAWAWANPEAAYHFLIDAGARGEVEDQNVTHEILDVIAGSREFAAEHGLEFGDAPAAPVPLPRDAGAQEQEYSDLIRASLNGPLAAADQQRLEALAGAKVERDDRATDAAFAAHRAPAAQPGEYDSLIAKSVREPSKMTAAENTRMTQLAGQREVEAGRAAPEDIQQQPPAPPAATEE